jgi:PAS domain S-box-containing protein
MQTQKVIEKLGYTPSEARVYLATLSLGEAHISSIAAKANLPRTSAQLVIDKLHKDGLVNFYVQRRYKYWVAERPERLLQIIQKREETMKEALPVLIALRQTGIKKNRRSNPTSSLGLFRMFADTASQPVLIANESVEIEYVNMAWERQYGYALEEVRGKNPRMFQSGKTPPQVYERMWKKLEAGRLFQSDEMIDTRKDGTVFTLLTTILRVKHGGIFHHIQILDEITERHRAKVMCGELLQTLKEQH